ncbi:hypothetical protein ABZ070_25385 [Streptomyces sp. NPDC006283]|uniref:hypothetical protein n=1 Tax=Streptomyces sp. NPDC006283 TaxID=3156741 RepID=UPI0033AFCF66
MGGTLVLDAGRYQEALDTGRLERRPMFTTLDGDTTVWADGTRERIDVVLLATDYRLPATGYRLPATGSASAISRAWARWTVTACRCTAAASLSPIPAWSTLGLQFQRSFASNTLRGVSRDADHVGPAGEQRRDGEPRCSSPPLAH